MSPASSNDRLIASWLAEGSRVLDLGCGEGGLLGLLAREKGISGIGVEIDEGKVASCIESGIQVIHADIESGLNIFRDGSYDCVVLSQTLQELQEPTGVVLEMLRVGKQAIVAIANAGHLAARLRFFLSGRNPIRLEREAGSSDRLVTIKDFEQICAENRLQIAKRSYLSESGAASSPLTARSAVYLLAKD